MPHLEIIPTHSHPLDHACALVVGYANGKVLSNVLDDEAAALLAEAISTVCDKPTAGTVTRVAAPWNTKLLVAAVHLTTCTSSASECCQSENTPHINLTVTPEKLRERIGAGIRALLGRSRVVVALPHEHSAQLEAIAEGALLGAYSFTAYTSHAPNPPENVVVVSDLPDTDALVQRAQIVVDAVHAVRDLVNTPANDLNTEELAQFAATHATQAGCRVDIFEKDRLEEYGLVGLLAVGQGSIHEPKLVRVEWAPDDPQSFIALVGKGITFDTGGYSLKPPSSMTTMKTDMTGAATMLQTVIAAARLNLPHRLVAWLCIAENSVSGSAQRVDDVITYRNGVSVEVVNTDAEGRLVVADGLIMACEEAPDAVIDIATLTGAQMRALGMRISGIMGSDAVRDDLIEAAEIAGEPAWPMPLPEYLEENLSSPIADIQNTGTAEAGMLTAGVFLKKFVGETPWGHIDIAGPAYIDKAWGYNAAGATGVMLRTLLEYIEQ